MTDDDWLARYELFQASRGIEAYNQRLNESAAAPTDEAIAAEILRQLEITDE